MSAKYALYLTAPERQLLTRIARGRCGCRRLAGWKREQARVLLPCNEEPESEGETDRDDRGCPRRFRRAAWGAGAARPWTKDRKPGGNVSCSGSSPYCRPCAGRPCTCSPASGKRAAVTEISYKIMRHKLELINYFKMWNGYPPVREAMCVAPMEKGPDLPRPAVRCALSRDRQGRTAQAVADRHADAAPRPATCDYACGMVSVRGTAPNRNCAA